MHISSATFIKGIRGTDPITHDGVPQYVFVGRSNVGKSSIINALTHKKDLVKVSDKPGKTSEINFFHINNAYYLVDLPGYGYAKVSPKEKEKLRKLIVWYMTEPNIRPHMVVLVLDMKAGLTPFDTQMIDLLREHNHPFIIAANKSDKLTQAARVKQLAQIHKAAQGAEVILTSTKTPAGMRALTEKLFSDSMLGESR